MAAEKYVGICLWLLQIHNSFEASDMQKREIIGELSSIFHSEKVFHSVS